MKADAAAQDLMKLVSGVFQRLIMAYVVDNATWSSNRAPKSRDFCEIRRSLGISHLTSIF
jgi:predicted membrane metal-binding protein